MIKFIENIGDFYPQHFFSDDFPKKVFDKVGYVTQKKDSEDKKAANHLTEINALVSPLGQKYNRFKNDLLNLKREEDKIKRTHEFHTEVLKVLGYVDGTPEYNSPIVINDSEIIPVRYNFTKDGKPFLFVMEMKAIVREGDVEPDSIYEQKWIRDEWKSVFPKSWDDYTLKPEVIKDALSELFLLPADERPTHVILMAGAKIFLIQYERWKNDSFLLFDLEELFLETQISSYKDYLALFYALLSKSIFLSNSDNLLQSLDDDAHKSAYGVTQNLKKGVIYAVENLANEAIFCKKKNAITQDEKDAIEKLMAEEKFAKELKDECLTMVYRLLFLFYAEAREDLEILPVKDSTYQRGYSLDMLRDLEMVALTTDSSRNGEFFSKSLWKLFDYLHTGVKTKHGFEMKPLDSPLFDNGDLKHLSGVQFRNIVLQQIIKRLSLSDGSKGHRPGRISYGNLGINQLGSVYESLLAFSGFFAADTLIEVKAADDPDGKEGTFLVPLSRRDEFKEEEILKDPENRQLDKQIAKGHFVYRLNGRDRKKSASYYTPEVLTQTTVKYTLKGIIDKLKARQEKGEDCADEILSLKILEPAMGAAAFHNEVINQLADAYLELKEEEEVRKGRQRIVPGNYKDELQKVKAFIAANNVYGVDLNPTAVELGKLSLWLNCMHRNMETPFFAHRLGTGNAVVGCWLKVYDEVDVIEEFPTEGTPKQRATPNPKDWWNKAPSRVTWDKSGNLSRKSNQIYHFLLPDDNMLASAEIKLLKEELSDAQKKRIIERKKDFKKPLSKDECKRLEKLCSVIDVLLNEHYNQIKGIIKDTTSAYAIYGQTAPQIAIKGYDEKELLAESRNDRSAPFYKLRMVMDYWCSLWFWDVREIADFPTRTEWINEIENILGIDLSTFNENATAKNIIENIKKQAVDKSSLFGNENRLQTVEKLHEQHRFFHHELEFLEVFKENAGFDVIVGNPPWVSIEMDEAGILSEKHPLLEIRKYSSPEVRKIAMQILTEDDILMTLYVNEAIWADSIKNFIGSRQNYSLLLGQRNNLYKCVLVNSISIINLKGFVGLVHPEGIYDDPKSGELRKYLYKRLKYHFEHKNAKLLFTEVHDQMNYSLNIYSGIKDEINFTSIHNIFHPSVIDGCFAHNGKGLVYGKKIKNDSTGNYEWNVQPHKNRIIEFTKNELILLSSIFEDSDDWQSSKLVEIHSSTIITVLDKIKKFKGRVSNYEHFITMCFNETNSVKDEVIKRETRFPDISLFEMIYSGPHFFVSNPLYKSPRTICKLSSDYDSINLLNESDSFFPRTNYLPSINFNKYISNIKNPWGDDWIKGFKVGFSKMINTASERTLQPALLPPSCSHIDGVISIQFKDLENSIEFCGLSSSILFDFIIKITGKGNFYENSISVLPLGVEKAFLSNLIFRTLLLNCLNKSYINIWSQFWNESNKSITWSKNDRRLLDFSKLELEWAKPKMLLNAYERRLALVEIDVIVALAFGLNLDELILILNIQFPVLLQNEEDTYYDQKGNIVFTRSQGLSGVGLERNEWEKITEEVNSMQRKLKDGDTYTHIIKKSELYHDQQITYYAPFDKCDRVEDYKVAWSHFEKIFSSIIKEKENSIKK
jgi:hypothetical protein